MGSLTGGIEFLELCGFERTEGDKFYFLPREKVEMEVLNSAGFVLNSTKTNSFFGLLSSCKERKVTKNICYESTKGGNVYDQQL